MRRSIAIVSAGAALLSPSAVGLAQHKPIDRPGQRIVIETFRKQGHIVGFKGRIDSVRFCERRRPIAVFRVRRGGDRRLAKLRADRDGRWRLGPFERTPPNGRYYAKAAPRQRGGAVIVRCRRVATDPLRVVWGRPAEADSPS